MLTLAAGQILWSIAFQWDSLTGGSNGLTGVWPSPILSDKSNFYMLCLILVSIGVFMLMKLAQSPFGWMLRASRDTDVRAQAIGIPVFKLRWLAFVISAFFAGLAGALFAFSKGSISPDVLSIQKSMDALLMVLLGGIESATGPIWGAWVMTGLQDTFSRNT
jgi:branched-chain amino acid transport system permease protein